MKGTHEAVGPTCVTYIFLYSLDVTYCAQLLKMIISQDTHLEPDSYGADIPRHGTYDFKLDTDLCGVERMSSKLMKAAELESRVGHCYSQSPRVSNPRRFLL